MSKIAACDDWNTCYLREVRAYTEYNGKAIIWEQSFYEMLRVIYGEARHKIFLS